MSGRSERARLKQIVAILVKHGVRKGFSPQGVRRALEELGPTFIKLGQILSTRYDLLPEPYLLELAKLQDDAKPEEFQDVQAVVEESTGRRLADLFAFFAETPAACASVAQVHLAELRDSRHVVVKVRRPGIKETMASDLALLRTLARLGKLSPQSRIIDPVAVVDELSATFLWELDFRREASNIERFAAKNRDVEYIIYPRVHPEFSTESVLVMEYLDGLRLNQGELLAEKGYDLHEIGRKLVHHYFKQVFLDGFFHADPHPGNILIHEGKIAYLDFGLMGEIPEELRHKLNRFLLALSDRDVGAMSRALSRLGIKRGIVEPRRFRADLERLYEEYVELPLDELDLAHMLRAVFQVCRANNLGVPREMALLLKGLVTLEAVVAKIAPALNLAELATVYARQYLHQETTPHLNLPGWREGLYMLFRLAPKIPPKLLALLDRVSSGSLRLEMEYGNVEKSLHELSRMVNRVVFALILAALIIGSSLIINANVGPAIYGIPALGLVGYLGAGVMGLWLLVSIVRSGKL